MIELLRLVVASTASQFPRYDDAWHWVLAEREANPAGAANQLVEFVRADQSLQAFVGELQYAPLGGLRIEAEHVAAWLVRRAVQADADTAVAELNALLNTKEVSYLLVVALRGIQLEDSYSVGGEISLVPWEALPDCPLKAASMYFDPSAGIPPIPSAAITARAKWPVVFGPEAEAFYEEYRPEVFRQLEALYDAIACMGLQTNLPPTPIAQFACFEESLPLISSAIATRFSVEPNYTKPSVWHTDDVTNLCDTIRAFNSRSDKEKDHLRLIASRLSSFRNGYRPVDRCIDLGIALESAFLSDRTDSVELSYRLRLRAAIYTERDKAARRRVSDDVRDFYRFRSAAVHTGAVDYRKLGEERFEQLLDAVGKVVAAAGRRLCKEGVPEWEDLVFSQDR